MIGIDTNVIVRYVAQDDAAQALKATKVLEGLTRESQGFISVIVLVELVWVMQGCFQASRDALVQIIEHLLRSDKFVIDQLEIVWQAFRAFQSLPQVDFADCLIFCGAQKLDCDYVATFDKSAAKTLGMKLLG